MQIQFKERPYERCFGKELDRLTSHVPFAPDRCDEFFLGFDDAVWLPYGMLRHIAHIRRRRGGIFLRELNHLTDEFVQRMPPLRFNLFIQYKRPAYIQSHRAHEWSYWNKPYYRFNTTPHQQKLLEQIEAASEGKAIAVYASPAFWKNADLWKFARSEEIISKSGIVAASRLAKHGCYTYAKAGTKGKGFSEPEDIEGPSLKEIVSSGVEQNEPIEAKQHILRTASVIREAIGRNRAMASLLTLVESSYLLDAVEPDPRHSQLIQALITIIALSDAFGVSSYMFATG